MSRRRGSIKAKLLLQQAKKVIYPIEKGLKSEESGKQYRWHLKAFIKWIESKYDTTIIDEMLLQLGEQRIQSLLIEYLDEYLHKEKHRKRSTIKTAEAAIVHFCSMNDIDLNTSKISKFVPADENSNQDRAYTRKEIDKLLQNADKRYRVVLLLLANGMRIGALRDLELGDLTPIFLGDDAQEQQQQQKIYRIWVYKRSKASRYYTFVTPECAAAIDDYLKFRKGQGEKDVIIEPSPGPENTPLIREQFRLDDRKQAANPRKVSQPTLEKTIERIVRKAGINTLHKVMVTHGFRKFAITQMIESDMQYEAREYLVGHRGRGMDVHYDRTVEKKRLYQWSKAINYLTIDPAFHLQRELKIIQGETNQKIARLESHTKMLEDRLRQAGLWDSCD